MDLAWDESELDELAQLQDRGVDAAAELFTRYEDRLRRMIHVRLDKRLYGRVDAGDVLQEAYLEVSRRTDEYLANPAVPFYVWIRQLTSQVLVDLYRQHFGAKMRDVRQEVRLAAAGSPIAPDSLAAQLIAGWTSPSQAAIREETYAELQQALSEMDEIDREVLALRHFEGLANGEVAKILGLQKTAASNRYIRALTRLRKAMSPAGRASSAGA